MVFSATGEDILRVRVLYASPAIQPSGGLIAAVVHAENDRIHSSQWGATRSGGQALLARHHGFHVEHVVVQLVPLEHRLDLRSLEHVGLVRTLNGGAVSQRLLQLMVSGNGQVLTPGGNRPADGMATNKPTELRAVVSGNTRPAQTWLNGRWPVQAPPNGRRPVQALPIPSLGSVNALRNHVFRHPREWAWWSTEWVAVSPGS